MEFRKRCGLCKKVASGTLQTSVPASLKLIKTYNKDYKGGRLCKICIDMAKRRVAAQVESNRENEDPGTSADSRMERDHVPSFRPANAELRLFWETSSSESPEIPAALVVFTPTDEEEENEPRPKKPRYHLIEESEETIDESEEDAPPEEVVQPLVEEEVPEVPTVDVGEDVQEAESSNVSSEGPMAPMPRNPRIRDEDLRIIMERRQPLESRGTGLVNNMPRNHAG